jgi:hypothetical protein
VIGRRRDKTKAVAVQRNPWNCGSISNAKYIKASPTTLQASVEFSNSLGHSVDYFLGKDQNKQQIKYHNH